MPLLHKWGKTLEKPWSWPIALELRRYPTSQSSTCWFKFLMFLSDKMPTCWTIFNFCVVNHIYLTIWWFTTVQGWPQTSSQLLKTNREFSFQAPREHKQAPLPAKMIALYSFQASRLVLCVWWYISAHFTTFSCGGTAYLHAISFPEQNSGPPRPSHCRTDFT